MGVLIYGISEESIEIPDRILDHLRVLFATKLRRGESFPVNFKMRADARGGRETLWIHPSIPVRFVFESDNATEIDENLLQELARRSNTTTGLAIDLNEWDAARMPNPRSIAPRPELERAA
ncbi:hypothetical protein [Microbacterium sp. C7(2022)]|uniref:DUF7882 family protein n=1 Tax=Microbacterium sp. C7(2022) TaxID=2992759 RepID=UPI00237B48A7|nr:hypothetical protein [Microbacterium sp. C7(2022)]MDE0546524.1 hypothetical protein [Microbacterium sp. C7(2022)]